MKKLGIIILIVAILGFLFWYFFLRAPKPISYITVPVERGTLIVSISGSGQVVAQDRADITSEVSGTIEEIYVQEGDIVEKDQDLFKIKNDELDAAKARAWANYLKAKDDLETAKERPEVSEAEIRLAEANKWSAWLDYETAKDKADERMVKSPIKGTVVDSSIKVGDSVGGQTTASLGEGTETKSSSLTIIDLTTLKAQISINEADLSKIQKDQLATLTLDALPEKEFTGKVVHIDTLGTVTQGIVTYNVDISLDNLEGSGIMPDMTVNTSIIIAKKDDVLLAPNSAIKTVKGKTQVQILVDNQPRSIEVETGLTDDVQTEIISGLKEGQEIITGTIGEEVEKGKPSPFKMPGFGSPKGSVGGSSHGFSK